MIPEPLAEFLFGFPIWALALVISGRFFHAEPHAGWIGRLFASAHGVLIAAAYAFACFASAFTRVSAPAVNQPYENAFMTLLAVALVSVVGSFFVFARRRLLLYHLLTVPALVAAALVGGLILSHDSL